MADSELAFVEYETIVKHRFPPCTHAHPTPLLTSSLAETDRLRAENQALRTALQASEIENTQLKHEHGLEVLSWEMKAALLAKKLTEVGGDCEEWLDEVELCVLKLRTTEKTLVKYQGDIVRLERELRKAKQRTQVEGPALDYVSQLTHSSEEFLELIVDITGADRTKLQDLKTKRAALSSLQPASCLGDSLALLLKQADLQTCLVENCLKPLLSQATIDKQTLRSLVLDYDSIYTQVSEGLEASDKLKSCADEAASVQDLLKVFQVLNYNTGRAVNQLPPLPATKALLSLVSQEFEAVYAKCLKSSKDDGLSMQDMRSVLDDYGEIIELPVKQSIPDSIRHFPRVLKTFCRVDCSKACKHEVLEYLDELDEVTSEEVDDIQAHLALKQKKAHFEEAEFDIRLALNLVREYDSLRTLALQSYEVVQSTYMPGMLDAVSPLKPSKLSAAPPHKPSKLSAAPPEDLLSMLEVADETATYLVETAPEELRDLREELEEAYSSQREVRGLLERYLSFNLRQAGSFCGYDETQVMHELTRRRRSTGVVKKTSLSGAMQELRETSDRLRSVEGDFAFEQVRSKKAMTLSKELNLKLETTEAQLKDSREQLEAFDKGIASLKEDLSNAQESAEHQAAEAQQKLDDLTQALDDALEALAALERALTPDDVSAYVLEEELIEKVCRMQRVLKGLHYSAEEKAERPRGEGLSELVSQCAETASLLTDQPEENEELQGLLSKVLDAKSKEEEFSLLEQLALFNLKQAGLAVGYDEVEVEQVVSRLMRRRQGRISLSAEGVPSLIMTELFKKVQRPKTMRKQYITSEQLTQINSCLTQVTTEVAQIASRVLPAQPNLQAEDSSVESIVRRLGVVCLVVNSLQGPIESLLYQANLPSYETLEALLNQSLETTKMLTHLTSTGPAPTADTAPNREAKLKVLERTVAFNFKQTALLSGFSEVEEVVTTGSMTPFTLSSFEALKLLISSFSNEVEGQLPTYIKNVQEAGRVLALPENEALLGALGGLKDGSGDLRCAEDLGRQLTLMLSLFSIILKSQKGAALKLQSIAVEVAANEQDRHSDLLNKIDSLRTQIKSDDAISLQELGKLQQASLSEEPLEQDSLTTLMEKSRRTRALGREALRLQSELMDAPAQSLVKLLKEVEELIYLGGEESQVTLETIANLQGVSAPPKSMTKTSESNLNDIIASISRLVRGLRELEAKKQELLASDLTFTQVLEVLRQLKDTSSQELSTHSTLLELLVGLSGVSVRGVQLLTNDEPTDISSAFEAIRSHLNKFSSATQTSHDSARSLIDRVSKGLAKAEGVDKETYDYAVQVCTTVEASLLPEDSGLKTRLTQLRQELEDNEVGPDKSAKRLQIMLGLERLRKDLTDKGARTFMQLREDLDRTKKELDEYASQSEEERTSLTKKLQAAEDSLEDTKDALDELRSELVEVQESLDEERLRNTEAAQQLKASMERYAEDTSFLQKLLDEATSVSKDQQTTDSSVRLQECIEQFIEASNQEYFTSASALSHLIHLCGSTTDKAKARELKLTYLRDPPTDVESCWSVMASDRTLFFSSKAELNQQFFSVLERLTKGVQDIDELEELVEDLSSDTCGEAKTHSWSEEFKDHLESSEAELERLTMQSASSFEDKTSRLLERLSGRKIKRESGLSIKDGDDSLGTENRLLRLKVQDLKEQLSGGFDAEKLVGMLEEKEQALNAVEAELDEARKYHALFLSMQEESRGRHEKAMNLEITNDELQQRVTELTQQVQDLTHRASMMDHYHLEAMKSEAQVKVLKAKLGVQDTSNPSAFEDLAELLNQELIEKTRQIKRLEEDVRSKEQELRSALEIRRRIVFRAFFNNWLRITRFDAYLGLTKWKTLRRHRHVDQVFPPPAMLRSERTREFAFAEASLQVERDVALKENMIMQQFEQFGSKNERPMSYLNVFKFFEELMDTKYETDCADIKARRQPRTMTEFMMEHLRRKYGMPKLQMKNLSALLLGIRQLMDDNHPYVILFARLLQVFHPDPIPFPLAMFLTKARVDFHSLSDKGLNLPKTPKLQKASTYGREAYENAGTGGGGDLKDTLSYVYRLLEDDQESGEIAVKVLKPELISSVDYCVFLILHKLKTSKQSPSDLFGLLSAGQSLSQQEFVEGLKTKCSVWVSDDDLARTFKALSKKSDELTKPDFETAFDPKQLKAMSIKSEFQSTKAKFLNALAAAYAGILRRDSSKIRSEFMSMTGGLNFLDEEGFVKWLRQHQPDLRAEYIENYWGEMLKISSDQSRGVPVDAFCRVVFRFGIGNYGKGRFQVKGLEGATEERKLERTDLEVKEGEPLMKIERKVLRVKESPEVVQEGDEEEEEEDTRSRRARRRTRIGRRMN
jgi:hypothetical protein